MESVLDEILERVRFAAAARRPLCIRGGGSKDFHGPAAHGTLLDTRALQGIVSYEPSELVVTARAGTSLTLLEATLAEQGQCLPFEPPHFFSPHAEPAAGWHSPLGVGTVELMDTASRSTVGGMVAAGLSGPARASVGAVRDYVLGAQLINGRAELLTFGGQVMKNVAGYDVSRLMAGAWGTLGLITEVSLKVLPVAPAEATLRFACTQAEALALLNRWRGQPLPLNASRWAADEAGETAAQNGTLYLRLRGAKAAVASASARLGGDLVDAASAQADWSACRNHRLPWFSARQAHHALWRLSLPPAAPALVLPAEAGLPLVEWHGALRWLRAPHEQAAAIHAAAQAVGGSASVFVASSTNQQGVGCGFDWKELPATSPALAQIQARLKHSFDPEGIFNPGRLSPLW